MQPANRIRTQRRYLRSVKRLDLGAMGLGRSWSHHRSRVRRWCRLTTEEHIGPSRKGKCYLSQNGHQNHCCRKQEWTFRECRSHKIPVTQPHSGHHTTKSKRPSKETSNSKCTTKSTRHQRVKDHRQHKQGN